MKLYIDQGNSRLKFWLVRDGRVLAHDSCCLPEELAMWLGGHDVSAGLVLRAASVRSPEEQVQLANVLQAYGAIDFARVDPVRLPTAYASPGQLGVDRWLAVLAVRARGDAVIVDAGTAFTVDLLIDGRHQGGYILPGLALQREALASRTARVSFPEPDWSAESPGVNTASCVGHGSLRALAALVRDVLAELPADRGGRAALIMTGGDAGRFAALGGELRPWLILEGLVAYHGDALSLEGRQ